MFIDRMKHEISEWYIIGGMVILTLAVPSPARPLNRDPQPGMSSVMFLVIHNTINICIHESNEFIN